MTIEPTPFLNQKTNLRLKTKTSISNPKELLALTLLIYMSMAEEQESPSPVQISSFLDDGNTDQSMQKSSITQELFDTLISYTNKFSNRAVDKQIFHEIVNNNSLFGSQLESLNAALSLVWNIGELEFIDGRSAASERTDGNRYPKRLAFTAEMKLVKYVLDCHEDKMVDVLLSWMGMTTTNKPEQEIALVGVLSHFAERAIFCLPSYGTDRSSDMPQIYSALVESGGTDKFPDGDAVGTYRIIKSAIKQQLFPGLSLNGKLLKLEDISRTKRHIRALGLTMKVNDERARCRLGSGVELAGGDPPEQTVSKEYGGQNILAYGVPGSGKSYLLNKYVGAADGLVIRTVFHADYTNTDFFGQISPETSGGDVKYVNRPGPFAKAIQEALSRPSEHHYLIIEEINRGNAPAIFGEAMQLLDRKDDGSSEYEVTIPFLGDFLFGDPDVGVCIPPNLSLLATMNSSDQNVTLLDNAFQRRWTMVRIENDISKVPYASNRIAGTSVSWKTFVTGINHVIEDMGNDVMDTGDSRLGVFFVSAHELAGELGQGSGLEDGSDNYLGRRSGTFEEKVFKYLWEDAFKFTRQNVFNVSQYSTLDSVIDHFRNSNGNLKFDVFVPGVRKRFNISGEGDELSAGDVV